MKKLCAGALILMALGTTTIVAATDVGPYYWVLKKEDFNQTSLSPPSLTGAPFQLGSFVERASSGTLNSGTITPPGSGVINTAQPYTLTADGGLEYNAYVNTQANLDAAFGSGGYLLNLNGGQGNYSVTLSLVGNTYPAETPKLNNSSFISGELVVDAAAPLTLTWNSFSDHDFVDDVIIISITDGSGIALVRNVLDPAVTSQAFAANFLKPEQTYNMELSFIKVSDKNVATIAGSTGLAGYARSTKIFLSTSTRTPISGIGNISTRGLVGTDDNVLISGFIITGDITSKLRVVVRAIGPSLASNGVAGSLQDPTLDLFNAQGQIIASNDNWQTASGAQEIQTAGLAPTNAQESALLQDLAPGSYTAIVRGRNNTTGVGLAEVYNLGSDADAVLANISTRGQVNTGDQVMIGGLIIQGGFSHQVIVRAIGPSLTSAGVANALANPTLQLFDGQGNSLAFNNNWKDTQQSEIEGTGIPPTNDKESAIVRTLFPGNYTAIVRGNNETIGVGLVEAYILN